MDPSRVFVPADALTARPAAATGPALPAPRPQNAPASFHVLTKPTGAICNLDCTYCFFLSKESLYPGSPFRMADDLLELYVRQVIESQDADFVTIAWQGGEPTLMGLDFFRRAMELVERYRRPGMAIEHSIQTNGTLLTPEWAAFFRDHQVLVGLSMDGPPDIHDRYRVDKGGKPTHDKVLRAARILQEAGIDVQHPVHRARGERGARRGGLPVLPGRGWRALPPVHPDHRARHAGAARRGECRLGRAGREGSAGPLHA